MLKHTPTTQARRGQALVEFALILPVALFLIFGILDFGRLFIAFTSASGALREASRFAATVGQIGTPRYMDCNGMRTTARQTFFVNTQTVTIRHFRANGTLISLNCLNLTDPQLSNGDYIVIDSSNTVNLITPFLSGIWPSLRLNFTAQRTVVKEIPLIASAGDTEPDGLADAWEIQYYGDPLLYSATDDPDGDGCNNGCEEYFYIASPGDPPFSLDPLNPDSDGDGLWDGDEIFIYGTDPQLPDTDGDGIDDATEIANGTDPLANEPVAYDDSAVVNAFGIVNVPVLANDHVEIATEIYIVTFDAVSLNGGTVTYFDNGTPADLTDDMLTFSPWVGQLTGTDEFSYTITDSSGIPSVATVYVSIVENGLPTPVPTAVPADIVHAAPFWEPVLNGQPQSQDWWRSNRGPVFMGYDPWQVEWWSYTGSTIADVNTAMSSAAPCTTTQTYDVPMTFNWGVSPPGQCGMGADNFAARWTRSFGVATDFTATFHVMADDAVQILVDGSAIVDNWTFGGGLYETNVTHTFTGGSTHTIVVRYAELNGNAMLVVNPHDGTRDDRGVCGWAIDGSDGYNGAPAWTDYPNRNYYSSSRCSVELRGAVNMAALANPEISFWEHWAIADANDTAWLEVREYGGGTPWYGRQLHVGPETQPAWTRQVLDLDHFDAINMNTGTSAGILDFTNDTIEFRFTLVSGDDSTTESGWWVDEIRVEEGTPDIFTIPWSDDIDSGNLYWQPGGSWAITAEKTRSGAGAWSDSPGGPYMPTADYILELDGEINVTTATDPLLIFYHSWDLGPGDSLYVEYTTDSGGTWAPIGGAALTTATTNTALVRQEVSLNAIKGTQFGLRFRLHADNDGVQGDGWYIDDVELAERDAGLVTLPFSDDVNNATSTYWYPDGTWAMASEANHGSAVGSSWSDSPGANYLHRSSSSLRSQRRFNIASLTNPELSFWYRRDLAANDGLFVEVSTDYGATWTTIWSRSYCGSGNTTETAPDSTGNPVSCTLFNQQLAWERISINMSAHAATPFYLRFRLEAMNDAAVANGVWIDDIRLAGYTETPHTVPFADAMEDAANWHLGGSWNTTLSEQYAGASSMTDSPGTNYTTGTWAILQLKQPISLAGIVATDYPILTWWDRYGLAQYDYARVQVSQWNGPGWNDWGAWQELEQHYFNTNTAWNQQQVNLSAFAGQKIRLRFVLDALNLPDVADGWYIDNVAVRLYNPTAYTVPYSENADSLTGWLAGGTWNTSGVARGTGTSGLSAGAWTGTFYDLEDAACSAFASDAAKAQAAILNNCAPASTSNALADVQFLCAAGQSPDPSGSCVADASAWKADHFGARFVRTFTVTEAGQYSFTLTYNDGSRLYVYPASGSRPATPTIDRWADTEPTTPSATADLDLTTGDYIVEVWYYEGIGTSTIALDIDRPSLSFYARSEGLYDDMLLTLDGLINLNGVTTPALSWYDQYELANTESCVVVEVALPYYRTDRWVAAYGPFCGSATSGGSWQTHSVANLRTVLQTLEDIPNHGALTISGNNARMALRFRLYADVAGNEWWVEDIAITGP